MTALLSVLTLNYFFIEPRHQLTIASSENVVALVVFLIVAVVVGRLAAAARERAREADDRARLAAAREREAAMLARAASDVMAGANLEAELRAVGEHVAHATGAAGARLVLEAAPAPREGEVAVRLPLSTRPGWLYATPAPGWQEADLRRIADPLARLIDVALERQRAEEREADAEAARRADVAKTAVLHAISHDLRSPLTAITTAVGGLANPELGPDDRADLVSVIGVESSRLAAAGGRPARPLEDRGRRRGARGRTGATSATSSASAAAGMRRPPDRAGVRRRPARSCGPTPPSSSACSPTCSTTPSASRPRARPCA